MWARQMHVSCLPPSVAEEVVMADSDLDKRLGQTRSKDMPRPDQIEPDMTTPQREYFEEHSLPGTNQAGKETGTKEKREERDDEEASRRKR